MPTAHERGEDSRLRQARRDTLALIVLIAVLVVGFGITTWLVQRYNAVRAARAWNWQKAGAAALQRGDAPQAANDYRNALGYGRDNQGYQFGLAQALLQSGELKQASHYFLTLWAESPQSGPVNLGLARLESKQNHTAAAVRYYHNAIYGIWPGGGARQRRAARRELISLLLREGQLNQADAEILALGASLPPTARAHTATGQQLLEVGDNHHALEEFRAALRRDPRSFAALVGAGRAAFRLAQYRQAQRYLRRATALRPHDIVTGPLLATTDQVLQLDPFAFGLSRPQRDARVRQDLQVALARLHRCAPPPVPAAPAAAKKETKGSAPAHAAAAIHAPPPRPAAKSPATKQAAAQAAAGRPATAQAAAPAASPLAQLAAQGAVLQRRMRRGRLFHSPDAVSQVMSFVFTVEQTTASRCGAPSGSDLALLLIAHQRAGAGQ